MSARPYRPTAPLGARSVLGLVAIAMGLALVLGLAGHGFSRLLFYVDLLVPVAIGTAMGALLSRAVIVLRVARPVLVATIAAAATASALAMMVAADYRHARANQEATVQRGAQVRQSIGIDDREIAQWRDDQLSHWTLTNYVRARVGLDDRGYFTGTPPVLGKAGAVALSIIELVFACVMAVMWAGRTASTPACPVCGAWREEHSLGEAAHGVSGKFVDAMLANRDAEAAAELLEPPDTREFVALSLFACPEGHDQGGGVLAIGDVAWTRRRRLAIHRIAELDVSAAEVEVLSRHLKP